MDGGAGGVRRGSGQDVVLLALVLVLQHQTLLVLPLFLSFLLEEELLLVLHLSLQVGLVGLSPLLLPAGHTSTVDTHTHTHKTFISVSVYLYSSISVSVYLYSSISVSVYLYSSISVSVYLYSSISVSVYLYISVSVSQPAADGLPPRVRFCLKFLPVKIKFFLATVTKCFLFGRTVMSL
uniref:Uncharacterized protein n=1 Tax=Sander lucioperca TaxID=283035 RepID=A0A8C9ZRT4_SANLU